MIQNQAFYFPIPKSRLVVANSAKCEGFNHPHGSYAASLMFTVVFRIDKKGEYFYTKSYALLHEFMLKPQAFASCSSTKG